MELKLENVTIRLKKKKKTLDFEKIELEKRGISLISLGMGHKTI